MQQLRKPASEKLALAALAPSARRRRSARVAEPRRCAPRIGAAAVAALACAAGALGCGRADEHLSPAAREGRKVYLANCVQCHNREPDKIGSLGPPVAGASRELLRARLLRASYPPGYIPKRTTNAMPALPHLVDEIDELAAYLDEVQGADGAAGERG